MIPDQIMELKKAIEKENPNAVVNFYPSTFPSTDVCPNCGFCKHCGRSNSPSYPYMQPFYQPNIVYC